MALRVTDEQGNDLGSIGEWLAQDQPIKQTEFTPQSSTAPTTTDETPARSFEQIKADSGTPGQTFAEQFPQYYAGGQYETMPGGGSREITPSTYNATGNVPTEYANTQLPAINPEGVNVFSQMEQQRAKEAAPKRFEDISPESWLSKITGGSGNYARLAQQYNIAQDTHQSNMETAAINQAKGRQDILENILKLPDEYRVHALTSLYAAEKQSGKTMIPDVVKSQLKTMSLERYEATKQVMHQMAQAYIEAHPELKNDPKALDKFNQAINADPHKAVELMTKTAELEKQIQETKLKGQEVTLNNQYLNKPATPQAPQAPQGTGTGAPAPTVAGPGAPANQVDTAIALRAQALGVDPKLALAIKGNEGSGTGAVSPKGATGLFQIMPDTARPYLSKEMQGWSNEKITEALKDPALNIDVALRHIGDLQKKFNNNPLGVFHAYHTGEGRVNPDGSLKEDLSDGNMTTSEYGRRGMARYTGQPVTATPSTSSNVSNNPHETKIAEIDTKLQATQIALEGLPPTAMFAKKREEMKTTLEELHRQREDLRKDYENSPAFKESAARATAKGTNEITKQTQLDVAAEAERRKQYSTEELQKMRMGDNQAVPPGTTHRMVEEGKDKNGKPTAYYSVKEVPTAEADKINTTDNSLNDLEHLYKSSQDARAAKVIGSITSEPGKTLARTIMDMTGKPKNMSDEDYKWFRKFQAELKTAEVGYARALFPQRLTETELGMAGSLSANLTAADVTTLQAQLETAHNQIARRHNTQLDTMKAQHYEIAPSWRVHPELGSPQGALTPQEQKDLDEFNKKHGGGK